MRRKIKKEKTISKIISHIMHITNPINHITIDFFQFTKDFAL